MFWSELFAESAFLLQLLITTTFQICFSFAIHVAMFLLQNFTFYAANCYESIFK